MVSTRTRTLRLLNPQGSPPAQSGLFSFRSISLDSGEETCLRRIKSLLKACEVTHATCSIGSDPDWLPTRVLDLHSHTIQLVESSAERKGRYIALSHCWGQANASRLILSSKTFAKLTMGIGVDELTPVFQNAVQLTRFLGIRYLWIDALCIIQDSEADWAAEAARMALVYSHATLTIASSCSQDSYTPFLRPRQKQTGVWLPLQSPQFPQGGRTFVRPMLQYLEVMERHLQEPLQDRAWCLQERVLSTRMVFFDSDQYLWECHAGTFPESTDGAKDLRGYNASNRDMLAYVKASEIFPQGGRTSESDSMDDDQIRHWYRLLREYCRRKLTYRMDILPALSGVATYYSSNASDVYLAGIWQQDLHAGLLWQFERTGVEPLVRAEHAPSWTWASAWELSATLQPSRVVYSLHHRRTSDRDAKLLRADIAPLHDDATGRLKHGILHLSGLARSVKITTSTTECVHGVVNVALDEPSHGLQASGWLDGDADLKGDRQQSEGRDSSIHMTALLLSQWDIVYHDLTVNLFGLLLLEQGTGAFVRRGTFCINAPMREGEELAEAQRNIPPIGHFKFDPRKKTFDGTWDGWTRKNLAII